MTVNSFEELGRVYGLRPRKRREKDFYCKICGGKMKRVSNVLLCENMVEHTDDNGNKSSKECGNRVILKIRRESGLMPPG